MKRYYFSRNNFTREFYLDSGMYGKNRNYINSETDIIHYLKSNIDLKRNSEIYLDKKSLNEIVLKEIMDLFSNSKVLVKLEDKFEY